jgi:hypothetical protein
MISETAWALLIALHRAALGGPRLPAGFSDEYAELESCVLAGNRWITEKGEEALDERQLKQ